MNMFTKLASLLLGFGLSGVLSAAELTITTTLQSYAGNGAYLAFYLTDANGKYQRTLWLSGSKSKYYKHLSDWARGSSLQQKEYDGLTGASVNSGATLTIKVPIDDALIDRGYLIRVDSAVEDQSAHRIDIEVPLTQLGVGVKVTGSGYIKSLSYTL